MNHFAAVLGVFGAVLATSGRLVVAASGLAALLIALGITVVVARHERRITDLERDKS